MKTKNQDGFTHWLMLIVLLVIVGVVGVFAFGKVKDNAKNKDNKKAGSGKSIDVTNPDKFIQADFVDLSKIYSISKFRSAEGHDFSGNGETCRSMKHYFGPQVDPTMQMKKEADGRGIPPEPDGVHNIAIYSPVDGEIIDIQSERMPVGEQLYIRPSKAKDYTIRLFHVYKNSDIKKGSQLKAGQKIGVISGYSTTDIAIEGGQEQFVSYFQVMPDNLFENYIKRGAKSRDDLIVSKEYRDAHPVPCNQEKKGDQAFQYPAGYDREADQFRLSGYVTPDFSAIQKGQTNCGNSCDNGYDKEKEGTGLTR